jgi:tight adherence protein C
MSALTNVLMGLGAPLFALSGIFLIVGLWETFLAQYFSEAKEERSSFLQGLQKVMLRRLGVFNRRFMWPSYEAKRHKQLIKAGEPANLKPEEIMAMQQVAFVFATLMGLMMLNLLGSTLLYSMIFGLIGLYYPIFWLNDQIKKRHHLITRALPYNLDLLTLSVEAGLDFTGALGKVVEKGKSGPLKDEFALVLKQLKMGKTREEGLKSLIARVDLPSLTSFITALIQADRMGTSIGKILRIQSTQLRIERSQKAEKLANEAPVKMLFPLIACIFPTVFLVLFGPIVFAFTYGDITK